MSTGETFCGVFIGVALPERSITDPPVYPDEILIFREPLMGACRSLDELEEEIALTVVHEVGYGQVLLFANMVTHRARPQAGLHRQSNAIVFMNRGTK